MLVAKINPPAKRVIQISPFQSQEFLGEYMIAKCTSLVIGATSSSANDVIEFEAKFGSIKYETNLDGTQGRPQLDMVTYTKVKFTHNELSTWGTDDTIIYQKIADKLGFNILQTSVMEMIFTV